MPSWSAALSSRPRTATIDGRPWRLLPLFLLALPAALLLGLLTPWLSDDHRGLRLFLAAAAVILLAGSVALSRRGSLLGAYLGLYLSFSHFLGHSHVDRVIILQIWWALSALVVALLAVRDGLHRRDLRRRAAFWLGPASLLPFVLSGALVGGPFVAAWRLTGWVLSLGMLLALRRDAARHFAGMSAGIGIVIAVGLYAGATEPYFDTGRFGGGSWWFAHPNVLAMIAAPVVLYWFYLSPVVALRLPVVAILFTVIVLTDSRTVAGALGIGMLLSYATGHLRIAVIVLAAAAMLLGGSRMFLTARDANVHNAGVLTGRPMIWEHAIATWQGSDPARKLTGFSTDINGLLELADGRRFAGHNVFIGALIRGGLLGVACMLGGLVLLLYRARAFIPSPHGPLRKGATAIFALALATGYTEDWLSGDAIWMALALAESLLLDHTAADAASTLPEPETVPV